MLTGVESIRLNFVIRLYERMDDKMMESGKAYIVFTPTGIGKTKKIDIELINLAEGDRQVMTLAQGVWWFAKKNAPLATYIGMKE